MDSWPQDQQRHKRTFDEMSQHASLSPSPYFFGPPATSAPLESLQTQFERRRTSHPHNEASRSGFTSQDNMTEPRQQPRPSLEHRTSQTIIDLTDDTGEPNMGGMSSRFLQTRPSFRRSDAALTLEDIIDLTEDLADDEVEFIDSRPAADAQPAQPSHNRDNRRLPFIGHRHRQGQHRYSSDGSPFFLPQDPLDPPQMTAIERELNQIGGADFAVPFARMVEARTINFPPQRWGNDENFSFLLIGPNPPIPNLDYGYHPFNRHRQQPKPQHQPPPAAQSGFTRSPTEVDVIICPACEKELVAKKSEDEPPLKKPGGKAPNKKDREEHPFWVIKECGHVYCNNCYQRRRPDKKKPSSFPEFLNAAGKVVPLCAVEGCGKDVGDKKHWVGVFM